MAYTMINRKKMTMRDKDDRKEHNVPKKERPPLIRGKEAKTNAGFQENISRERRLGKPMKEAVAIAYGEADEALRKAHEKVKKAHRMMKKMK